jgi:hypothetical protein
MTTYPVEPTVPSPWVPEILRKAKVPAVPREPEVPDVP